MIELENTISALQSDGPVLVMSDFNAHLGSGGGIGGLGDINVQGQMFNYRIYRTNMYTVSLSQISSGPSYTFFIGDHRTTVDDCLLDSWGAHLVGSCHTIEHHSLNISDRLHLSIHFDFNSIIFDRINKGHAGLNWRKARNDGYINGYSQRVHDEIRNLYVD